MNDDVLAESGTVLSLDGAAAERTPEELYRHNLAAFRTRVPYIHSRMQNHTPVSKLVFLENGEPSVEFNNELIYKDGAITEAKRQLENIGSHVARVPIARIPAESFDVHARAAHKRLIERMSDSGFRHSPGLPHEDAYFLICLGVGLGQHLDELVERTKCRVLVLIEPNADLLYHSMHVYDWVPLLDLMAERHSIQIIMDSDTANISTALHGVFRQYNPAGLDGSMVFRHYQTGMTNEIEREFSGKVMTSIMGLGFFQDEINMISQTYKNLESGESRVISALNKSPEIPCFIVATGPSLDETMPFIKKHQDDAIIFACGSSLSVLAENDITADFWVITERVKDTYDLVAETAAKVDVSKVILIGSSTVFPGLIDHFDEKILFIRPGLSVAPLFRTRDDQVLKIPDPLAANSGLSATLHLGFREFYFLGVDVGSKYKDRGHAKGGHYATRDDYLKELGIPVPGNFGGTAWTTPVLKWSKESLEKLTKSTPGRMFYNLSDGALIEKVTPLHWKAAKIKKPKRPKQEVIKELLEACAVYSREEFDERWDEVAIIDRLPAFCDELKRAVVEDDMDDFGYAKKVSDLLKPGFSPGAMEMLIRGTAYSFMIGFEWWHNRIIDPEERKVARQIFKEEFTILIDTMSSRAVEIFMGLEDDMPWTEEFSE